MSTLEVVVPVKARPTDAEIEAVSTKIRDRAKEEVEREAEKRARKQRRRARQKKKKLGTKRIRGEEIRPPSKSSRPKTHPIAAQTAGNSWGPRSNGHNRSNNRQLEHIQAE